MIIQQLNGENMEIIKNKYYNISFENEVLSIVYNTDIITFEVVENSIVDKLSIIDKQKKYPSIADVRNIKHFNRDARQRLLKEDSLTGIKCCAVIVKTKVQVVLYNFFMITQKPPIPTKLFNNYPEALKWFENYN